MSGTTIKYTLSGTGIILYTDKDETMVKYSAFNESEQMFVSKYMNVLPIAEELKKELERN